MENNTIPWPWRTTWLDRVLAPVERTSDFLFSLNAVSSEFTKPKIRDYYGPLFYVSLWAKPLRRAYVVTFPIALVLQITSIVALFVFSCIMSVVFAAFSVATIIPGLIILLLIWIAKFLYSLWFGIDSNEIEGTVHRIKYAEYFAKE